MSYDQILWNIEATRLGFKKVLILWNFTGTLTALRSRCLLNFRAINLEWMKGGFRCLLFIIATGLRNWLDALAMDVVQARWNCSITGSILDKKSSYILSNNNLQFHIFSWYINRAYIYSPASGWPTHRTGNDLPQCCPPVSLIWYFSKDLDYGLNQMVYSLHPIMLQSEASQISK